MISRVSQNVNGANINTTMTLSNSAPAWLKTAESTIGVREVPGAANSPTIMRWARQVGRYLGIPYAADSTPWCGLWTAWVFDQHGITPPPIAIRASQWGTWGTKLTRGTPGAVLVFTRAGGGHVGLYASEDEDNYHVVGGNQSDSVSVMKLAKNRCTAIRWPAGQPAPTSGPVFRRFDGRVSTNEA